MTASPGSVECPVDGSCRTPLPDPAAARTESRSSCRIQLLGSVAPLIAAAYGLTRRERGLTDFVLQGYPARDIAALLLLSAHTVQQHPKSIFAKTSVRSRRELVGNVFMRHYQPRIASLGVQTMATSVW
jgi:DNA-binding CsgD family transcriptional regulator